MTTPISLGSKKSTFDEITYTARDGLRLYARHYPALNPPPGPSRRPVVCVPGITRNCRDFHVIAQALSSHPVYPRSFYTLDMRGRGNSAHDPDPKNYAVAVEMLDVIDFLTLRSLSGVAMLGTSRGGLISMGLAAAQPSAIGCVILNDIGPVLERDGLSRIAGYIGRTPLPHSWPDATRMVRDMNRAQFPRVSEAEWGEIARQFFNEINGKPAPGYDPQISNSLSVLDGPPPAMWGQFEALTPFPLMELHGENSDILSAATVAEMGRRHPRFTPHTVRWEGHAPLLRDDHTIAAVSAFLVGCDDSARITN